MIEERQGDQDEARALILENCQGDQGLRQRAAEANLDLIEAALGYQFTMAKNSGSEEFHSASMKLPWG